MPGGGGRRRLLGQARAVVLEDDRDRPLVLLDSDLEVAAARVEVRVADEVVAEHGEGLAVDAQQDAGRATHGDGDSQGVPRMKDVDLLDHLANHRTDVHRACVGGRRLFPGEEEECLDESLHPLGSPSHLHEQPLARGGVAAGPAVEFEG